MTATTKRKYSKKASRKVARALRERKRGELRSGRTGKKVVSRAQAIAIGLSEARREGEKVPPPPGRRGKQATRAKKTVRKKAARRKPAKRAS